MALQYIAHLRLLNGLPPVSSILSPLFPVRNFTFINICLYTVPPSVFGHPFRRLPWGLVLNTWVTFLLLCILLTWPIQCNRLIVTNVSIPKSPNSWINSILYRFLQSSFTIIPPYILLKTLLSKVACRLAMFLFNVYDNSKGHLQKSRASIHLLFLYIHVTVHRNRFLFK